MFPTMIVDDFFEDPNEVRKFALSLDYFKDPENRWPGLRTKSLHEISPPFYNKTMCRLLNIYYNTNHHQYSWSAIMHFQKINKKFVSGWIHSDHKELLTNIVYLNENPDKNSGTTIYNAKSSINLNIKKNLEERKLFFDNVIDDDEEYRKSNNEQYEESIIIKNKYNRLLSFDGHLPHGANGTNDFSEEERLTLLIFIDNLNIVGDRYPLIRMKTSPYY